MAPPHSDALVFFGAVVQGLGRSGAARNARVIVEKPFGRDLASARSLNETLREVFDEASVFRIDHYLGKDPVQNLAVFRFENTFLEPIWNRNYVDSVQITMVGVARGDEARIAPIEKANRGQEEVRRVRVLAIVRLREKPSRSWKPRRSTPSRSRTAMLSRPLAHPSTGARSSGAVRRP